MRNLLRDVRFGVRLLARNPGFTAIAVLTLGLGIGANTAIFSVVYGTLIEPLPYHDPEQLVMVWAKPKPDNRNAAAAGDFLEWRKQSTVFQGLHAWTGRGVSLAMGNDRPEQISAAPVTPGWIQNFGLLLQLGRDFLPEEGEVGKDDRVILSHALWQERFEGDPQIVGRQVRLDGRPHTVVGVLRAGPADRIQHRLYVPLAFQPEQINHDFHWLSVMGRLKPGVTLAQANAEMNQIMGRIAEAHPASKKGWSVSVEPLQNNFLPRNTILGLWFLLAGVAFVLLIACANVANLLLARGAVRQRELAVRSSLGASPRAIATQLLAESVVLAGLGGLLGIALAVGFMRLFLAVMPAFTLPSEVDIRLSIPVLAFSVVAAMVSGVIFGCAPAWQATRQNLNETLKEGGRALRAGRNRLQRALVVVEFALALTLLAGGGLAVHSLMNLSRTELGFPTERLLTFFLPIPATRLEGPERIRLFHEQLHDRIAAVPGVQSVSVATGGPLQGGFGMAFNVVGRPVAQGSQRDGSRFLMVTPDYFRTYGLQVTRGRGFDSSDTASSPRVAVINEAFVKRYFANEDPLAQRLAVDELNPGLARLGAPVEWQVIGVLRDVRAGGPRNEPRPEIHVPFAQSPWPSVSVAVRTAGDPNALRNSIGDVVQKLDPDVPMSGVQTMEQRIQESMTNDRFNALLFAAFAVVALVLAAIGIYGVMSFVVAQRSHELGLRMALGADRHQVVQLVMRDGIKTALLGTLLGFAGAYGVGRAMQGMWYGVSPLDLGRFGAIALVLVATALLACYVPARRAATVDPVVALREH
jgi:putative ABC transport system permease protein